jgi:hypothetical protein
LGDGKAEVLILHSGRGEPLVLLSWGTWNRVARTIAPRLQDLSAKASTIAVLVRMAGANSVIAAKRWIFEGLRTSSQPIS